MSIKTPGGLGKSVIWEARKVNSVFCLLNHHISRDPEDHEVQFRLDATLSRLYVCCLLNSKL